MSSLSDKSTTNSLGFLLPFTASGFNMENWSNKRQRLTAGCGTTAALLLMNVAQLVCWRRRPAGWETPNQQRNTKGNAVAWCLCLRDQRQRITQTQSHSLPSSFCWQCHLHTRASHTHTHTHSRAHTLSFTHSQINLNDLMLTTAAREQCFSVCWCL